MKEFSHPTTAVFLHAGGAAGADELILLGVVLAVLAALYTLAIRGGKGDKR